jgi:hypothetical protein
MPGRENILGETIEHHVPDVHNLAQMLAFALT